MNAAQVANVTNEVAVTGFIRRDLYDWFVDNYITSKLLEECRNIRTTLLERFAIHFVAGKKKDNRCYYIPEYEIAFGERDEYDVNDICLFDQRKPHLFTKEEARRIFCANWEMFKKIVGLGEDKNTKKLVGKDTFWIRCFDGRINIRNEKTDDDPKDARVIPCCKLSKEEFHAGFVSGNFALLEDANEQVQFHNIVMSIICEHCKYINIPMHDNNYMKAYNENQIKALLEHCRERAAKLLSLQIERSPDKNIDKNIERAFSDWLNAVPVLDELQTQIVLHAVLMADTYRCLLKPKTAVCLEESGEGHWELFDDLNIRNKVRLHDKFAARDPHLDYCPDGVVGIDFGTKSTVVSLLDENNQARLIRVGTPEYSVTDKPEDYENPTVLEFMNIQSFLKSYQSQEVQGRPFTSFSDIKSAHEAQKDLSKAKSQELITFLTDIKQWCGDTTGSRVPTIRDHTEEPSISLPAFKDCDSENGFDPLEIYAYYLGLSINNMYNKVFLQYKLSFTTTYEKEIRDKMTQSFERGIKRALPDAIVKDVELMKVFSVKSTISEPAAYAICAMKEYGFQPKESEKVFYSVFDFGGGTTDMIFGIWRAADHTVRKEKRYTWVVEQFKGEGDKYLGGENLLELMAYNVFTKNKENLEIGDVSIPFTKPANVKLEPGFEKLINDSPTARRNMMKLTMMLRPLWEGLDGFSDEIDDSADTNKNHASRILKGYKLKTNTSIDFLNNGYIKIWLDDDNGNNQEVTLYIDTDEKGLVVDLIGVLEERIEKGINTYIHALGLALEHEKAKDITTVQLLLAGNSSKSPILDRLLRKRISEFQAAYQSRFGENSFSIEVLPPLGTEQSYQKGAKIHNGRLDRPTGKTGVAYGLVATDVLVDEEISSVDETIFPFYIGLNYADKFTVKVDRSVGYGEWQPMGIPADDSLELYYTSLADAKSGSLEIGRTKRKICPITSPDADKDFYIRHVNPDTIEYGIGDICNDDGSFDASSITAIDKIQLTL